MAGLVVRYVLYGFVTENLTSCRSQETYNPFVYNAFYFTGMLAMDASDFACILYIMQGIDEGRIPAATGIPSAIHLSRTVSSILVSTENSYLLGSLLG